MRTTTAIVLILAAVLPAAAAEMPVRSAVDAVTVYPRGATVVRSLPFSVPAGPTTLVATDFPAGLNPASLRILSATSAVTVDGVDSAPSPETGSDPAGRALQDLQDQRAAVDAALQAKQVKQDFIRRIARGGNPLAEGRTDGGPFDPAALRATWNAVGDDLASVGEAIRQDEVRLRAIDAEIARAGAPGNNARTAVHIALDAQAPAQGRLLLSYEVTEAGWTPRYDARLDARSGALTLTRRAALDQQTGEDWTDAALTVSTARPAEGAAVPALDTVFATLVDPRPVPAPVPLARVGFAAKAMLAEAPAPAERDAVLDTAGVQASWQVPGRTTLPSGPGTHLVRLADVAATPVVAARVAPALATTAFLEARFDQPDAVPLLAGPVSVFRDGLFAGESRLPLAAQGEPVRLGLGADDRIAVKREVVRRMEGDAGAGRKAERREFRITLRNGRPDAVKVAVEEAVPVSETGDVRVELLPASTPPTTRDADGRRGVLVWESELAPGATRTLTLAYRVSWPANREIVLPD